MAYPNFRTRYKISVPSGSGSPGDPKHNLALLGIFMAIGLFILLPVFPPFGLIWCIIIGRALLKTLTDMGYIKKNVENKIDWEATKRKGKQAAQQYKQRISESSLMEEKQPYRHPHTPVNYSYDKCAQDRRLEQIKSLKEAGIIDEAEYKQRRDKILAGK